MSLGDDRPGAIAHVLAVLAAADLNLEGFAVIEGLMHLVTQDASIARRALEGAGVRVRRQCDVLVVDAPNAVGAAALVFRRISDAGVNVSFTYVAANDRVVIAVDRLSELAMLDLSPGG